MWRWGIVSPLVPFGPGQVLGGAHAQVWGHDLRDGRSLLPPAPDPLRKIECLALDSAGERIVAGCGEGVEDATAHVFDLGSGTRLANISTGHEMVRGVALIGPGRRAVLMGTWAGLRFQVWDLERQARIAGKDVPYSDRLMTGAVSPSGDRAISGSAHGELTAWELEPLASRPLEGHAPGARITGVAFASDGRSAYSVSRASGSRPAELRRWDLASGASAVVQLPFEPHGLAAIPGTGEVVVGGKAGLERWSVERGARIRSYTAAPSHELPHVVAACASRVAVAGQDGRIQVFASEGGERLGGLDLAAAADHAVALAFGPGERLFVGTRRGVLIELEVK